MHYFDSGNRLSMDGCALKAKDYENQSIIDYLTYNVYDNTDIKQGATKLVQEYPNMKISYGYGTVDASDIDKDSKQKYSITLREREPQQLSTRVFQAVPNFGRGQSIPTLEAKLIQGLDTSTYQDCHNLAEYQLPVALPLTECMQRHLEKAAYVPDTHTIGKVSKDIYLDWRKQKCK